MEYNPEEYVEMIICYGLAGERAVIAARIFRERNANRYRYPDGNVIRRLIDHAVNFGQLVPVHVNDGRNRSSR